jgi:hypothetical protein
VLALAAAGCSAASVPGVRAGATTAAASRPGSHRADGHPPALTLQITPAPYQLPAGIAREVVFAQHGDLLIAGGLTQRSATTAALSLLDPVTGRVTRAGRLAQPTHDAAGALLSGRPYVFGGGVQASIAGVQAVSPGGAATIAGLLPGPRSDLSSVTLGGTAYLLGGYNGASYDRGVLATTDGRRFRTVAALPVPVRYPAVAAVSGRIWVFGGQTTAGPTDVIQQVIPGTGRARVVGFLPHRTTGAVAFILSGRIYIAGGQTLASSGPAATQRLLTSNDVLAFNPARGTAAVAGHLPVPVSNAAAAVLAGTAYLVGGSNGKRQIPTVTRLRPVPSSAALPPATPATSAGQLTAPPPPQGLVPGAAEGVSLQAEPPAMRVPGMTMLAPADPPDAGLGTGGSAAAGDSGASPATVRGPGTAGASSLLVNAPWLGPALTSGHLAPGSDPSVLPGDILIADNWNNRLLIVDARGRIRWEFPRRGDLAPGQTFRLPDDAFFSPDGREIIATEEEDSVISVISIARHKMVYRYGTPGVPGNTANHVANPDDAMMMPGGMLIAADIENCRVLLLSPPAHRPHRVIGQTSACAHNPPQQFASPNGAFPATNGHYLVTEITGDWASEIGLNGHLYWSTHPPGVAYPSDTNEVYPGRFLTADYSAAGQVVEFDSHGHLLWRFGGLNHPSLALPLPNGDILVNDDYNDRVIVIDPVTNKIVWQYGHTGIPGTAPGYLNDPDGVDLTPPNSMLITHAATMGTAMRRSAGAQPGH